MNSSEAPLDSSEYTHQRTGWLADDLESWGVVANFGSGLAAAAAMASGGDDDGDDAKGGTNTGEVSDDVAADVGGKGKGGVFSDLSVLLANGPGFDLSEHSCGLICANALNTRRVVYDLPNRRMALLVDGVDEAVPSSHLF